jgi:isopentenyl-diphosphate Delta-isomerase
MAESPTAERKDAHLELCATGPVEPPQNRTLLECVHLVHDALPEAAADELDGSVILFGKRLRWPLMITGMTGGTERAGAVNRALAALAEQFGVAFGVGSQRAMLEDPSQARSYQVRVEAPTAALVANLGLWQVVRASPDEVERLIEAVGADGLAVHLNAAQELVQPEGDRDFRGGLRALEALASRLGPRLMVKETGCGISPSVARRLVQAGVQVIDVSGLGGTSWVRVEALRSSGAVAELGECFAGWGIPTAAAIAAVRQELGEGITLIASGGLRDGLDLAKALALGADLCGVALPLLRALQESPRRAEQALEAMIGGLRMAMLLTGARRPGELRGRPKVVTGELKDWLVGL